jgi:hypothetical protein
MRRSNTQAVSEYRIVRSRLDVESWSSACDTKHGRPLAKAAVRDAALKDLGAAGLRQRNRGRTIAGGRRGE